MNSLVLVCDRCGVGYPVTRVDHPWPECCGAPMRLANTTDRDGRPTPHEHTQEAEQ